MMMESAMQILKSGAVIGGACVAACAASALLPGLLGGVALGGVFAALDAKIGFAGLLGLGAATGVLFWRRRSRKSGCGCDARPGCKDGEAVCELETREPT
jgi:hypothetical protein